MPLRFLSCVFRSVLVISPPSKCSSLSLVCSFSRRKGVEMVPRRRGERVACLKIGSSAARTCHQSIDRMIECQEVRNCERLARLRQPGQSKLDKIFVQNSKIHQKTPLRQRDPKQRFLSTSVGRSLIDDDEDLILIFERLMRAVPRQNQPRIHETCSVLRDSARCT